MARGRRKGPVYRDLPKQLIPKSVKSAVFSGVALLFILIGGGVAYTYFYSGNGQPAAAAAPIDRDPIISPIKPTKPPANAKIGASVQSFSSLAQIGTDASIYVKTTPGAKCKIEVLYYNTTPAVDAGLLPKVADEFGTIDWTWTVGPATPIGMWPVNITCALNGKTAFVQTHLAISK